MKYVLFIIVFLFTGCFVKKKIIVKDFDSEILYDETCCNFINSFGEFDMLILEYVVNCECTGIVPCASNCVGLHNGYDTIRVLSFCNYSHLLHKGDIIHVVPDTSMYDPRSVRIALKWEHICGDTFSVSRLSKTKYNTIWGKLINKQSNFRPQ